MAVTEISQSPAASGSISPADGPGFPITISQPGPDRIFGDVPSEAEDVILDSIDDFRPTLTVVLRPVDMRPEVADLMPLGDKVGLARVPLRGVDPTNHTVHGPIGEIVRDVLPTPAVVPADVDLAVVGARPEHALLDRRLVEGVDHAAILHTQVVGCESAAYPLSALVVGREIGADLVPALATVPRPVYVLARHIDGVGIV